MNQFSKSRNTTSKNSNTATGGNAGRQFSATKENLRPFHSQKSKEKNGYKSLHNADIFPSSRLSGDISMKNTSNGCDKSATEYTYKFSPIKYTSSSFLSERYRNIDVAALFIESAREILKEKISIGNIPETMKEENMKYNF